MYMYKAGMRAVERERIVCSSAVSRPGLEVPPLKTSVVRIIVTH